MKVDTQGDTCTPVYTCALCAPHNMLCGLIRRGRQDERTPWYPARRLNSNNSLLHDALLFAKSFCVPFLLDHTTILPGGRVIFLNLNVKKLSLGKVKEPIQGHLSGKQGS